MPARAGATTVALLVTLAAAAATFAGAAGAAGEASALEPLRVEEAFVARVEGAGAARLRVLFDIADGHYLYRDRTSAALVEPAGGVALGEPVFPPAVLVDDEFFGEMATYRDALAFELPLEPDGAAAGSTSGAPLDVTVDVTFQGCADIGLCYPPTTVRLDATLPPARDERLAGAPAFANGAPATSAAASLDALGLDASEGAASDASPASFPTIATRAAFADEAPSSPAAGTSPLGGTEPLANLFGGDATDEPEILAPEIAYVPVVTRAAPDRVEVLWRIEPGYYLYRDKLRFRLSEAAGATLAAPVLDPGTLEHDEFFGDVEVWRNEALAVLPLAAPAAPASSATLEIDWQGCADIGVCFPPQTTTLALVFDDAPDDDGGRAPLAAALANGAAAGGGPGGATVGGSPRALVPDEIASAAVPSAAVAGAVATGTAAAPLQSEQGRLAALLGSGGLWLNALTFFGLGLLLAFTPCVLPMIPILSSLIVGRGESMTATRAFGLSLVYVLVMATTYALLGIAVGLSGYNVQPMLQDPLVLSAIAALFVVLSLSMFGLYELQVPRGLQERLTRLSNRQRGGEVGGVAVMALLSTLIVGPCVTAPLAGALIYIADTGDAAVGGVALFSLGLGMGAPLLLIGTSAGTLLPRAGAWMERTRQVFGVLLLAMAIYMLSRFLSPNVTMALAGALALASGVLFGATDTLGRESSSGQRFAKGLGLVVSLYGAALLVGAMAGGGNYLRPLEPLATRGGEGVAGTLASASRELEFRTVKGPAGLAAAVAEASAAGRPLMLDFYADWCISCKEMEAFTFTDPAVRAALGDALLVQADVTANDAEDQALLDQFGLFGPPGIIFYDARGRELPGARVVGFVPAGRFAAHVERAIGGRAI